jgi:hypothetical protein
MIAIMKIQLPKKAIGMMVAVNMNLMPLKIGKEVCL